MDYYKGWNDCMSDEDTVDLAYWERNMLALYFAMYSNKIWKDFTSFLIEKGHEKPEQGLPSGWYYDTDNNWEGWKRVISLFDGKVTFHVPDDFDIGNLPQMEPNWDGHSTEEKWLHVMKLCGVKPTD